MQKICRILYVTSLIHFTNLCSQMNTPALFVPLTAQVSSCSNELSKNSTVYVKFKMGVSFQLSTPGGASTAASVQSSLGPAFPFQTELYWLALVPATSLCFFMAVGMPHSSRILRGCDGSCLCCGRIAVLVCTVIILYITGLVSAAFSTGALQRKPMDSVMT